MVVVRFSQTFNIFRLRCLLLFCAIVCCNFSCKALLSTSYIATNTVVTLLFPLPQNAGIVVPLLPFALYACGSNKILFNCFLGWSSCVCCKYMLYFAMCNKDFAHSFKCLSACRRYEVTLCLAASACCILFLLLFSVVVFFGHILVERTLLLACVCVNVIFLVCCIVYTARCSNCCCFKCILCKKLNVTILVRQFGWMAELLRVIW